MKKMVLVCFLMLCNGFIYGSDDSTVSSVDFKIIKGQLENYLAFMQKISPIADSILVKNSLQEITQYTSNLSKYSDSDLVLREYANAILGQITFLTYEKINSETESHPIIRYRCSLRVPVIRVPVIKETELFRTDLVQRYVDGYKTFQKNSTKIFLLRHNV